MILRIFGWHGPTWHSWDGYTVDYPDSDFQKAIVEYVETMLKWDQAQILLVNEDAKVVTREWIQTDYVVIYEISVAEENGDIAT